MVTSLTTKMTLPSPPPSSILIWRSQSLRTETQDEWIYFLPEQWPPMCDIFESVKQRMRVTMIEYGCDKPFRSDTLHISLTIWLTFSKEASNSKFPLECACRTLPVMDIDSNPPPTTTTSFDGMLHFIAVRAYPEFHPKPCNQWKYSIHCDDGAEPLFPLQNRQKASRLM